MLPFTPEQFFGVFEAYNRAIYPAQWLLFALALLTTVLAMRSGAAAGRIAAALLGGLWLWTGIAYHLLFFSRINPAAVVFGALFIVQAAIFFFTGVWRQRLTFRPAASVSGFVGACLIVFALFLYPALGTTFGHVYPRSPTFGAPCPTTIFTLGLLLWTDRRVPFYVLVIPFIWSLIGFTAALTLGVPEDTGLLVAGVLGAALLVWGRGKPTVMDSPGCSPLIGSQSSTFR